MIKVKHLIIIAIISVGLLSYPSSRTIIHQSLSNTALISEFKIKKLINYSQFQESEYEKDGKQVQIISLDNHIHEIKLTTDRQIQGFDIQFRSAPADKAQLIGGLSDKKGRQVSLSKSGHLSGIASLSTSIKPGTYTVAYLITDPNTTAVEVNDLITIHKPKGLISFFRGEQ